MPTQIQAVVITASDACSVGEREDTSGETLVRLLTELGAEIVAREIVNDDPEPLADMLRAYADRADVNLIVTTGGTGFGPRQVPHLVSVYGQSFNMELADHLERAEWKHRRVAGEIKTFFDRMARAMRVWVDVCRQIGY